MQIFLGNLFEVAAIHLAVVDRSHITIPDDNVISTMLHVTAYHVRMGVFENLVLSAPCCISHVAEVGVIPGTGKDLMQIGNIEPIYAAWPLDNVYAPIADGGYAGRLATAMLEGTNKAVGVVEGMRDAEAAIVSDRFSQWASLCVDRFIWLLPRSRRYGF